MAMPRVVPAALAALAIVVTLLLMVLHAVLARALADPSSAARTVALLSSALEGLVLIFLIWCCVSSLPNVAAAWERLRASASPSAASPSPRTSGVWFGLGALLCTVASATSVATLVCLSNTAKTLPDAIFGSSTVSFLIGASVALGFSFAAQLVFLVTHFVLARLPGGAAQSLHTEEDGHRSPQPQVKSIPYSQTSPVGQKTRGSTSMDSRSPPGSSGGRSATETLSSIRSSLSHVVRPISSKTRLLSGSQRSSRSQRSGGGGGGGGGSGGSARRPTSGDSAGYYRDRSSASMEDGFDSWDTSGVDPQNRQTVLDTTATSSPAPGRFLETIPASPTTSRSPSPGTPLDLDPPHSRRRRRSRSYSPAASQQARLQQQRAAAAAAAAAFTQQPAASSSASELHIHPLFRSDSPTPPPAVSAGTVVTAAPNGGQAVIPLSDRQSIRSLGRMRSGSLPAVPSPLSRQGSFDDFHAGRKAAAAAADQRPRTGGPRQAADDEDEDEDEDDEDHSFRRAGDEERVGRETERKMTPPIPEWILSAGSRKSLSGYNSRKVRVEEGAPEAGR